MTIEIVGRRAVAMCGCGYVCEWTWPFGKEAIGSQEKEIMRRVVFIKSQRHREVCLAAQRTMEGGPNWSKSISYAKTKGKGHYAPVRLVGGEEGPVPRRNMGAGR